MKKKLLESKNNARRIKLLQHHISYLAGVLEGVCVYKPISDLSKSDLVISANVISSMIEDLEIEEPMDDDQLELGL